MPFWVKRDTTLERSIVNHGNCATFESVESELRCLDRGVQKGFQDLGKVVEFLREDIFYEKSVFPFCGISILLSFFLSFYENTISFFRR